MAALFLTTDLMFSSKVTGAAAAVKVPLDVVMSAAKVLELAASDEVKLVLLDLTFPSLDPGTLVPQLREKAPQAYIVAYGPHVQDQQLMAAQQAGCDGVMTRGQLNQECQSLLLRTASGKSL